MGMNFRDQGPDSRSRLCLQKSIVVMTIDYYIVKRQYLGYILSWEDFVNLAPGLKKGNGKFHILL